MSLQPDRDFAEASSVDLYARQLDVRLDVELGTNLRIGLRTHNRGTEPFALTQALHSYFAVGVVEQVQLQGLEGLRFDSRVDGTQGNLQVGPFKLYALCDSTYVQANEQTEHYYQLVDPDWQRQICLTTQSSQSVVVWNPGDSALT